MATTTDAAVWMSVNDAAARLGVSPAVLRYQIIQGQVRSRLTECGKQVCLVGGVARHRTGAGAKARRSWWKMALTGARG